MKPLAVLSDIHGNLEALKEVLKDIDSRGIRDIISLGDIIGYGPDPETCVRLVRERGIKSLQGNHEQGIISRGMKQWFNPVAKKALNKTAKFLSKETRKYLASLPLSFSFEDMFFVHGFPPDSTKKYLFEVDNAEVIEYLAATEHRYIFVGHTHELVLIAWEPGEGPGELERKEVVQDEWVLDPEKKYLVNVGSVGQPRDGNNAAKYVVFDRTSLKLEVVYVAYDYEKTAAKIRELEFPEQYARRLY